MTSRDPDVFYWPKPNWHGKPAELLRVESNIEDFENRRFYVQMFDMKLLGYILDEDDFEVVPTINRTLVAIEVEEERIYDDIIFDSVHNKDLATFSFIFKPNCEPAFSFTALFTEPFSHKIS